MSKKEHSELSDCLANLLTADNEEQGCVPRKWDQANHLTLCRRARLSELQQARVLAATQFARVATEAGRLQARMAEQERAIQEVDRELRAVQRR